MQMQLKSEFTRALSSLPLSRSNVKKGVYWLALLALFFIVALYVYLLNLVWNSTQEEQDRAINLWQLHFGSIGFFGVLGLVLGAISVTRRNE